MRRRDIQIDVDRVERFFRQAGVIDRRGVTRLGVRCWVIDEPPLDETAEEWRLPTPSAGLRAEARARRSRETPLEVPLLPDLARARRAVDDLPGVPSLRAGRPPSNRPEGRTARLFARLTRTIRSAPFDGGVSLPSVAPAIEWARPFPALKKS